jgi:hypothetical protein
VWNWSSKILSSLTTFKSVEICRIFFLIAKGF